VLKSGYIQLNFDLSDYLFFYLILGINIYLQKFQPPMMNNVIKMCKLRMHEWKLHSISDESTHKYTHTTVILLFWNLSGTTWVSRYQKGKPGRVKPMWIYWSKR